nr:hypothetical protein DGKKSRWO_DGKKSRWO_CDS_0155 [uncultured phage]CAI9752334.1 hypothetical protein CVNMHQAP_CVNMHQAP_CDS_0157 [uncultured phage]
MTKQYLLNNLTFLVRYDNTTSRKDQFVRGYMINRDNKSVDWDRVFQIIPAEIQDKNNKRLQNIVNRFYSQEGKCWEEFLDSLVLSGEIQDVPEVFCS